MELLGPAGFGIHDRAIVEECAAELVKVFRIRLPAAKGIGEYPLYLGVRIIRRIESLETMVRQFAAHRSEEVVPFPKGLEKVLI